MKRRLASLAIVTALLLNACGSPSATLPVAENPTPTPVLQVDVSLVPNALARLPILLLTDTPIDSQVVFSLLDGETRFQLWNNGTELNYGSSPVRALLIAAPGTPVGTYTLHLQAQVNDVIKPLIVVAHVLSAQELTPEQHANLAFEGTDPLIRTQGRVWFASSPLNLSQTPTITTLDPVSGTGQMLELPDNRISALAPVTDGSVWAGVSGQLLHLTVDNTVSETSPYFTPSTQYGRPRRSPVDLTVDDKGTVWFIDSQVGVVSYIPSTQIFISYPLPESLGHSSYLIALAQAGDGGLWMTQWDSSTLVHFDPVSGQYTRVQTPTPNAGPLGLKVAPDGSLWFAEGNINALGHLDPSTNSIREYPLDAYNLLPSPSGPHPGVTHLSVTSTGNIWASEESTGSVVRFTPSTGAILRIALPRQIATPSAIAADPDGSVRVVMASNTDSNIIHITP